MREQINVFKAVNTIADFIGIEPQDVAGKLGFFLKDEQKKKLFNAYNETVDFYQTPLEERAKKLGYTVTKEDGRTEISVTF